MSIKYQDLLSKKTSIACKSRRVQMAKKIALEQSVITCLRAGVMGFLEWATCCGFSVICKGNFAICIFATTGSIMESIILIARKMKCRCRYYQCKMLLYNSLRLRFQELEAPVLRRVIIKDPTAILTAIWTCWLFECERVLFAFQDLLFHPHWELDLLLRTLR